MTKQWTCKDCVKQGTDACYFKEVVDGYKYCHDIVVDTDYAYAQGRADMIEEVIDCIRHHRNYFLTNGIAELFIDTELEELKERK